MLMPLLEEVMTEPEVEVIVPEEYVEGDTSPDTPFTGQRIYLYDSDNEDEDVLVPATQAYGRVARRPDRGLHQHDPDDLGFIDGYNSDVSDESDLKGTVAASRRDYQSRVRPPVNHRSRRSTRMRPDETAAKQTNMITVDAVTEELGKDKGGKGRNLTMREFHRPSTFVRARYPTKFHEDKTKQTEGSRVKHAAMKLPPSFRPRTRYGKEARVVSDKTKRSSLRQWPTPPVYPQKPKVKDVSVDCHILRMVETMDIGTQNVPFVRSKQSQCGNPTNDAYTQYPRVRRKEIGLHPMEIKACSQGVQSVPETKNAGVETSVSIMYYPNIIITEDHGTQCMDDQGNTERPTASTEGLGETHKDGCDVTEPSDNREEQYSADDFDDCSGETGEVEDGNESVKTSGPSGMYLAPPSVDTVGHTDSDEETGTEVGMLPQPISVGPGKPPLGVIGRTSSIQSVEVPVHDDVHDLDLQS